MLFCKFKNVEIIYIYKIEKNLIINYFIILNINKYYYYR